MYVYSMFSSDFNVRYVLLFWRVGMDCYPNYNGNQWAIEWIWLWLWIWHIDMAVLVNFLKHHL